MNQPTLEPPTKSMNIEAALYALGVRDNTLCAPIVWNVGPHPFLDDFLIERSVGIARKVVLPPRFLDAPIVTGGEPVISFGQPADSLHAYFEVLRDDLTTAGAPPDAIATNKGNPGAGIGSTVLAWTRDGEMWHRDRHSDKFFGPDPKVGAWDHAVSWIDSAVAVGDELFRYSAGYRWGHKLNKQTDRQLGVVKTQRDRFVARVAGPQAGNLTTPVVTIAADRMTLNVNARGGEARVRIPDAAGKPVRGFDFADCKPISSDSLTAPVEWRRPLAALAGKSVRLEFQLREARLFALELNKKSRN